MVKTFLRCRFRSGRGAELIELALVLPILLLMFAAIVDFAFMFQRYLTVSNAAREGARIAVLPGYSDADIKDRVTQYVKQGIGGDAGLKVPVITPVSIDPPGPTLPFPARRVTVEVEHNYLFLGPVSGLLGGGSWTSVTLKAASTMRVES